MRALVDSELAGQVFRYIVNGLVATSIHYGVLRFNIEVLDFPSAGLANGVAAVFGIAASFVGSRYFVFRGSQGRLLQQGALFLLAYGCIAVLHGLVLFVWSDVYRLDYTIGFLVATGMQVACSFLVNKFMVFR